MKRPVFIASLLLFVVFIVILFEKEKFSQLNKNKSAEDISSTKSERGYFFAENDRKYRRKNVLNYKIDNHKKILEEFRQAANDNDEIMFHSALSKILSRDFLGNPEEIIEELLPYLEHKNKLIRFDLAKTFVWAGLKNQKVIDTLTAFVDDEDSKPLERILSDQTGEKYNVDLRKDAARLLANYRIIESTDSLWSAYQQTSDRDFLRYLSVFKDRRVMDEALNLVREKKATYGDLFEIFGSFKIDKAAEPLEKLFKARQKRYPENNQMQLAWSIYQITEKQEYFDYLVARDYYINNTFFEVPSVLQILENTLRHDNGSGPNSKVRGAFLSLLARENGREIVERYLVDVFSGEVLSPIDATLRYRAAAYLDSDRVNSAVQKYEDKYNNGLWGHYSKRKGWPINDLLYGYEY